MRHALQFALLISATAALTACGGGGGTSATLSGGGTDSTLSGGNSGASSSTETTAASFTAWNAVTPGSSSSINGISQTGTYVYDSNTDRLTNRTIAESASGASYAATYSSSGQATALTVTPAGGAAMSFNRGTDTFGALGINSNIDFVVSQDDTKEALAANPYGYGWNYQSFGVWATGATTGSGTFGAMSIGAETAGSAIPTSGSATYSGYTGGRYVNSDGDYWYTSSTMTAATNFNTRSIAFATSGTQMTSDLRTATNNANLNLTGTLRYAAATNQITGSVRNSPSVASSVGSLAGTVNGRFYGPTAQEIGGTFSLTSGSNALEGYAGAFGGKKP
jgi:hypothetical protein